MQNCRCICAIQFYDSKQPAGTHRSHRVCVVPAVWWEGHHQRFQRFYCTCLGRQDWWTCEHSHPSLRSSSTFEIQQRNDGYVFKSKHLMRFLFLYSLFTIWSNHFQDRSIAVWDMVSATDINLHRVLVGHRAAVNVVDFDEKYIVSASGDRTIKVKQK